jgi:alpha-glucosidase
MTHNTDISIARSARRQSCSRSRLALLVALFAAAWCLPAAAQDSTAEVKSPDGNLVVTFAVKNCGTVPDCPTYTVSFKGRTVIADSRLGLTLTGAPLDEGMNIVSKSTGQNDTIWTPVCAERSTIRDHYNQLVIDLQQAAVPHHRLQLTFRAYDEGIAFCYTVPQQDGLKEFTIEDERTQFSFTADHTAWAVYSAQARYDHSAMPLSRIKPGAERPLTVRVGDDLYAAVTEARTVDYARMKFRLAKDQPHTLDADLGGRVQGTAPFTSPWRVIMLADNPGKLLEQNYLILNLNDQCALQDTSWIKPGKVIRDLTLTTAGGKACVDFCLQRGLQYVEYDAGWYGNEDNPKSDASAVHLDPKRNPDPTSLDLQAVIDYANSKNVGVILYVNHLAMEKQLDQILPLYEKWGVKGVKYGFVNVGSQHWTQWLHEAIRKAAAHHLMVDIHDEFRNTGYQRTYPNLMTVEGIGGNEEFPSAVHTATVPFTRFLTGPADYTFCWYDHRLKLTHAHQLAISTIFFSPWQFLYWYDAPAVYDGDPALDYWKYLPTTWDETRVLKGDIGNCASVARRKGQDWYVGTIHAAGPAQMDIPLSFLDPAIKYTATIYRDQNPGDPQSKAVKIETLAIDSKTVLKADIPANGGQAIRIVPVAPNGTSVSSRVSGGTP